MPIPEELREMMHGHGGMPDYPVGLKTPTANAKAKATLDAVEAFTEAEPENRFSYELNVGSGFYDILDKQNPLQYMPTSTARERAVRSLCNAMNNFPELSDSQEWVNDRAGTKEQVEQAIREITQELSRAYVSESDPMKPLRNAAEMLRNRGIE